jgi:hypothetical protein
MERRLLEAHEQQNSRRAPRFTKQDSLDMYRVRGGMDSLRDMVRKCGWQTLMPDCGSQREEWGPRPSRDFVVFCCTGRKRDIRLGISKGWGYSVCESLTEYRAYCVVRVGDDCTATDGKSGWEVEDAGHRRKRGGWNRVARKLATQTGAHDATHSRTPRSTSNLQLRLITNCIKSNCMLIQPGRVWVEYGCK